MGVLVGRGVKVPRDSGSAALSWGLGTVFSNAPGDSNVQPELRTLVALTTEWIFHMGCFLSHRSADSFHCRAMGNLEGDSVRVCVHVCAHVCVQDSILHTNPALEIPPSCLFTAHSICPHIPSSAVLILPLCLVSFPPDSRSISPPAWTFSVSS